MTTQSTAVAISDPRSLSIPDDDLMPVLQASLYPGARPDSIRMVLGYCRAAGLDPMQKPVHIVPMSVKKPGTNQYEWRDVVMPGIGLYRTQAARTGQMAGIDEPDFGPEIQMPGAAQGRTVPEWCRVTVYRMIGGQRVAFTAREYWLENYATAGKDSAGPNAMWARRPRGQIAKCAEAQALRKAFPEIGSQPTADETVMEPGDVIDMAAPAAPQAPQQPAFYSAEEFAASLPKWREVIEAGRKSPDDLMAFATARSKRQFTAEQRATMHALRKVQRRDEAVDVEEVAARMVNDNEAPPASESPAESYHDDAYGEAA